MFGFNRKLKELEKRIEELEKDKVTMWPFGYRMPRRVPNSTLLELILEKLGLKVEYQYKPRTEEYVLKDQKKPLKGK